MVEAVELVEVVEAVVAVDPDDVPAAADKTLVGSASATSTGDAVVDDVVVDDVVVEAVVLDGVCVIGDVLDAGAGGASIRINAAKLTMSDEKSEAWLPLLVVSVRLVVSSGRGLKRQPCGGLFRLLGKPSLVTPISTL